MEQLQELLKDNKIHELRSRLSDKNVIDIAEFCNDLTEEECMKLFRFLPKAVCADVFAHLDSAKQKKILESITDSELTYLINDLAIDDAVDVVEEMPANIVAKILRVSEPDTRKLINQYLKYPDNSAGSVMTAEYIAIKDSINVGQALDYIKNEGLDSAAFDNCYVIDGQRKLEGYVPFKTLVFDNDDLPVTKVMEKDVVSAQTTMDQEQVAELFRKYDLTSLPIVDKEIRLVGIITVDDIVDVIDEENTEDFHKMSAMTPSDTDYLQSSIFNLAKHRILWLMVLMISATFTGNIIRKYEDVLQSVVLLAAYIPVLMDTGGNAGSQSATLVIRGLALGDIEISDLPKIIWKEFGVSIIVGITLGVVNFIRIYLFDNVSPMIALVVCFSLFCTVILAEIVGGMLPILAKACHLDPAIMASPLITTIVDACALMIFFGLSTQILHLAY